LTAIGNDSDFSQIFAEQLRLQGRPGDVALGISTSGMSANVNYGLEAARQIGMLTIGFSGKDGGRTKDVAEYCLTVPSFSIHRIQEVHTTRCMFCGYGPRNARRRGHHMSAAEPGFTLTCPVPSRDARASF